MLGPSAPLSATDAAIAAVAAERKRQIDAEGGWSVEHDDIHASGEMAMAAASYALAAALPEEDRGSIRTPSTWPWDASWWKPTYRVRDLVKAAALLIAEIERLERASSRTAERRIRPDIGRVRPLHDARDQQEDRRPDPRRPHAR